MIDDFLFFKINSQLRGAFQVWIDPFFKYIAITYVGSMANTLKNMAYPFRDKTQ